MNNEQTPLQNAIRLLFILFYGAETLPEKHHSGAIAIFRGEVRLHAMDFWVRYPDYLANELIDLYQTTGQVDFLDSAEKIFEDQEPDLRRIPMIRYKFGAYDKVDNALAVLISKGLIYREVKQNANKIQEYYLFILPLAYSKISEISRDFPLLCWYEERAKLVAELAKDRGGTALKEQQYKQIDYKSTSEGSFIPPITDKVRLRLQSLKK